MANFSFPLIFIHQRAFSSSSIPFSLLLCCHSHSVHFVFMFVLQLKMLQARGEPVPTEHLWDAAARGRTLGVPKVRTQSVLAGNVLPAPSTLPHREKTESPVMAPSSARCATGEGAKSPSMAVISHHHGRTRSWFNGESCDR